MLIQHLSEIKKMKKKGISMTSIGEKFGTSRQRVHQIIKKNCPELLEFRSKRTIGKRITIICKNCGKPFEVIPCMANKKYHVRACAVAARSKFPEKNPYPRRTSEHNHWRHEMMKKYFPEKLDEYKKRAHAVLRQRYHSDSAFREAQREYQREYRKKRLLNDPNYGKKQREKYMAWYKENREKVLARNRESYLRRKSLDRSVKKT